MQLAKPARYIFQGAAFTIFTFQMILAIEKYLSYNTITTSKMKDKQSVSLPEMFLCKENKGFNMTKAQEHGYTRLCNS